MAKVGTPKAGGTISQQAAVHPWLAADAHVNKRKQTTSKIIAIFSALLCVGQCTDHINISLYKMSLELCRFKHIN
jgi:hypothetical protein